MTYLIRNSDQTIKTFCERGDDILLGAGETLEFSPLSFTDYAKRLVLSLGGKSGEIISIPVGSVPQIVTIDCPDEKTVGLEVNGNLQTILLENGHGSLTLDTGQAGKFNIRPADRKKFCPAGESCLLIVVRD